jgi:hypothetical protein
LSIPFFNRDEKIYKYVAVATLFSFFAFFGYCVLIITRFHNGFNALQMLSIYYLILATGGAVCLVVGSLAAGRETRMRMRMQMQMQMQMQTGRAAGRRIWIWGLITALLILACTVNGFSSLSAQTFIVARFNLETLGMSNEDKIEHLNPGFAEFLTRCASQVAEDEGIVVLDEHQAFFTNYYLYPKKVYVYHAPSLKDIPQTWLQNKNIKWAILYNSPDFKFRGADLINLEQNNDL